VCGAVVANAWSRATSRQLAAKRHPPLTHADGVYDTGVMAPSDMEGMRAIGLGREDLTAGGVSPSLAKVVRLASAITSQEDADSFEVRPRTLPLDFPSAG
jgi:hypothetical protein